MDRHEARRVLGVGPDTPWDDVRRAYREQIRHHHPDRTGEAGVAGAVRIIEAYRVLESTRHEPEPPMPPPRARPRSTFRTSYARGTTAPPAGSERSDHGFTTPGPAEAPPSPWNIPLSASGPPAFARVADDTLHFDAPADETFRWLLEAANEIGEITYLDRSGPIMEVLCRFVDEPATSLLVTTQGRADGTDAFCSAESIEARPGPPTEAVVDVYEHALRALSLEGHGQQA
ncbi:MAG: J domain-containing protein [Acidimicrobiales bacterium]|nr:J domain-containing protein [Acidimicrobiales bacterium]